MRNVRLLLVGIVVLGIATNRTVAREYFVSQNHSKASDENPGTAESPLKTISKGVSLVHPGDTVVVKTGVYRENVEIRVSGTAEKRITLKAAPGERVLVNGADPINGWKKCTKEELHGNPNWANIYCAQIDWKPVAVFVNGKMQTRARFPKVDKTMYRIKGGNAVTLTDDEHLTQPAGFWNGATLVIRASDKFRDVRGQIVKYDADTHAITVDQARPFAVKPNEHLYFIENAVGTIDAPGQYVLDTSVTPHNLYLWSSVKGEIDTLNIEGTKRGAGTILVTWGAGVGYVTIDGLEIAYGQGGGIGSMEKGGHHVEILNCFVHDNRSAGNPAGIGLMNQSDCLIRHCLCWRNVLNGVTITLCKNITVEENDVYDNDADGLHMSMSSNLRFVRNFVHKHWYEDHPDSIQCFKGVDGLLLEGNLFLNGGQMWQCSSTYHVKCLNNIWCGSHLGGMSLSNRTVAPYPPNHTWELRNNTVAYYGVGAVCINKEHKLYNNLVVPGRLGGGLLSGIEFGWLGDHNLYWANGSGGRFLWEGKSVGDFGKYQQVTGQDKHGRLVDPKFRNAPHSYWIGDRDKAPWYDVAKNENTRSKLCVGHFGKGEFEVGDFVEVNWDGVVRKVQEVGESCIVIDPPLDEPPRCHDFTVSNWKKNSNFALDLRLIDDSPGKKMGDDGKEVGSTIDIQAYMKGDFNGDGKRDIPEVPKELVR